MGPNLKRHLTNVHVKRGHIFLNEVVKFFSMGLEGHKKRGPARKTKAGKKMKGRVKRWCPQPNCHYLGPYLPQHLTNKHRMKPSSGLYKTCLKIALKYKGVEEELEDTDYWYVPTAKEHRCIPRRKPRRMKVMEVMKFHQPRSGRRL